MSRISLLKMKTVLTITNTDINADRYFQAFSIARSFSQRKAGDKFKNSPVFGKNIYAVSFIAPEDIPEDLLRTVLKKSTAENIFSTALELFVRKTDRGAKRKFMAGNPSEIAGV